jgi:hypothetical protein
MRSLAHRLLVGSSALIMTAGMVLAGAPTASAYGAANWQLTFSGTGTIPNTPIRFGFWGWCDLAGGTTFNSASQATSGTGGDCQFSEYVHSTPGSGFPSANCAVSFNLAPENGSPAWQMGSQPTFYPPLNDWFISGTQVINPASLTSVCETFLGISPTPTFSDFDSVLPVVAGHSNLSGALGTRELQITETPLST